METRYSVQLPAAYKEFLKIAGREAADFMVGTEFYYRDLFGLREAAEELLMENEEDFRLPDNAFVIEMHQGYQFCYLLTAEGENPPVYSYNEALRPRHALLWPTYLEYLDEAVKAKVEYTNEYG